LFLIWIVLSDPLKAAFDPTLNIARIKSQTEVEDLSVVAVVVADGGPTREAFFPSPITRAAWFAVTHTARIPAPLDAIPGQRTEETFL
jgi:hypothetical protein